MKLIVAALVSYASACQPVPPPCCSGTATILEEMYSRPRPIPAEEGVISNGQLLEVPPEEVPIWNMIDEADVGGDIFLGGMAAPVGGVLNNVLPVEEAVAAAPTFFAGAADAVFGLFGG